MLNLSIISLTSSFLFASNSPLFVKDHYFTYNCHFQRFMSTLFYNQKALKIDKSSFDKGLGSIIVNEFNELNEQKTFFNESYHSTLPIDNDIKSISIINCKFSNIQNQYAININNNEISLYITRSTFVSCLSNSSVLIIPTARCLTMTHVCTYQSGTTKVDTEGAILFFDMRKEDFLLCLYNSFVSTSMDENGESRVINIINGDQYYRCNNLTESPHCGFKFNSPECFSFALSTVVKCCDKCLLISGYDSNQCPVNDKLIDMSNFLTTGNTIMDISGTCPYKLTLNQCVLLCSDDNPKLAKIGEKIEIDVINCLILNNYQNEGSISFEKCITVNYDESHITLHAHYTNGAECVGPENIEKNNESCDAGDCADKQCNKTIMFPSDVYQYTTLCHDCSLYTKTPEFSESSKFSESFKFSESNELSNKNQFTTLDHTSNPSLNDESSFEPIIIDPGKQGSSEKGTNKAMIGAIAGVLALAVIAAIVATVLIIRKRKLNIATDVNLDETNHSGVTTNNNLNSVMAEDDPFADDFVGDSL